MQLFEYLKMTTIFLVIITNGKKKPLTQLRIKGFKVVPPGIELVFFMIDYQ